MWIASWEEPAEKLCHDLVEALVAQGISLEAKDDDIPAGAGLIVTRSGDGEFRRFLRSLCDFGREHVLVILQAENGSDVSEWTLLSDGAADVLALANPLAAIDDIAARILRVQEVESVLSSESLRGRAAGSSAAWKRVLRRVIEIARYTAAFCLVTGESGTGKELIARLIHDLDPQRRDQPFVTVDCTTLSPELAGSELFGHARGAFTNAVSARDGAFALANGGTLFLDELGELPPALQAQLLRAAQEKLYKRVGDNLWQTSDFRLICATNRDLAEEARCGRFRSDLLYRIAQWQIRMPSLAERPEDIPALVDHFMATSPAKKRVEHLGPTLRKQLFCRSYPGNVRELKNLVYRIIDRQGSFDCISVGALPEEHRPRPGEEAENQWTHTLGTVIEDAVHSGIKLRDIGAMAESMAVRAALRRTDGNVTQAAFLLGMTPRALQIRRATERRASRLGSDPVIDDGAG